MTYIPIKKFNVQMGMNYGWIGSYNSSTTIADIATLKANGITAIRPYIPDFSVQVDEFPIIRDIALQAKLQGLLSYVGITASQLTSINSGNQAAYQSAAVSMMNYAIANGIKRVCIGNECESFSSLDPSPPPYWQNTRNFMRTVAASCDTARSAAGLTANDIKICYTVSEFELGHWIADAAGLGKIDLLDINMYGIDENYSNSPTENATENSFKRDISQALKKYGNAAFNTITEFNIDYLWSNVNSDQDIQEQLLERKINIANEFNLQYMFYYTFQNGNNDEFAARLQNGTYRKLWQAIINRLYF